MQNYHTASSWIPLHQHRDGEESNLPNLMPCQDAQNRRQAAFFLGWQGVQNFLATPSISPTTLHSQHLTILEASSIRAGDVHFVESLTGWSRIKKSKQSMRQGVMASSDGGDHAADSGTLWKMKESTAADHRPIAPFIAI